MRFFALPFSLIASLAMALGVDSPESAEPVMPTQLTLLGTAGGPGGHVYRSGIASLIRVGDHRYIIDAGEGVARQVVRAGNAETQIPFVFLTHLHDDHTAGLPALMTFVHTLNGKGMKVIGPPQTESMIEGILGYMNTNSEIRAAERRISPPAELFSGEDVGTGLIYSDEAVKVIAVENSHFHLDKNPVAARNKSYSYRFETPDKVIVFTGDTGPSKAVENLAHGADILVAEMVSATDLADVPAYVVEHMLEEHLSPSEVGKLAATAQVKTLVLSHIRDVSADDVSQIKQYFTGKVFTGKDLDQF